MPLPLPDAPAVTVIQPALLTADHVQPAPAVTVMLPAPPAAAGEALLGEIEYVQGGGVVPACVTVKVCPAAVIVPVRELVAELAATE